MKYAKPAIFGFAMVVLAVVGYASGAAAWVVDGGLAHELGGLLEHNFALAAFAYCVVSLVGSVVFALPGVLFALAAGALFGPVWGTLLCWVSMACGACVSFLAGRYFLKESVKPKLERYPLLNSLLFDGIDRSDVFLLAVTRLVPLFPFNVQNFAYGVTDMRFVTYAVYSALFILPGTAAYTLAAAGVVDAENRPAFLLVAAALIVVSVCVAFLLKRKAGLA